MWHPVEESRPAERLSVMLKERRVRCAKTRSDGTRKFAKKVPRGVRRVTIFVPFQVATDDASTNPQPCKPFVTTIASSVAQVEEEKKLLLIFLFTFVFGRCWSMLMMRKDLWM